MCADKANFAAWDGKNVMKTLDQAREPIPRLYYCCGSGL